MFALLVTLIAGFFMKLHLIKLDNTDSDPSETPLLSDTPLPAEILAPVYDSNLSAGVFERGSIGASKEGCYLLSSDGILLFEQADRVTTVCVDVQDMLPSANAVAYRIEQTLYCWEGAVPAMIAEDVTAYAWQGDDLIYADKNAIYRNHTKLAALPEDSGFH